jgi:hypothetical protein
MIYDQSKPMGDKTITIKEENAWLTIAVQGIE